MSLKTKLSQLFKRKKPISNPNYQSDDINIDDVGFKNIYYKGKPVERDINPPLPTTTHTKKHKHHHKPGKVTRATKKAEYSPQTHIKGGRIIRTMPKQLQKIKEAQEQDAS
jgi:hypothetical protein